MSRPSRRREFALLAGVTLLCLIGAELVLRTDYFLYESSSRVYSKTHELQETDFFRLTGDLRLPYRMAPSVSKWFWWGTEIRTNEGGYLGDARSSPESTNLLIAGDSVAFGLGVAHDESFPQLLRQALPEARIAVLAAPGYNSANEVEWIARVVESGDFAPEHVVLQFGLNDYLTPTRIVEGPPYSFYERIPTRAVFPVEGLYAKALDASQLFFRANHALTGALQGRLPLFEVPDRQVQLGAAVDRLLALARTHGFTVTLLQVPYFKKTGEEARFERAAAPALARFDHSVDLSRDLAGRRGFWFDRMHPNAAGHRRIADRLRRHLATLGVTDR